MDYQKLMYWATIQDNFHVLLIILTIGFVTFACIYGVLWMNSYMADKGYEKRFKKACIKWLIISILPFIGVLVTPDEDDMLLIIAGTSIGQVIDSTNHTIISDDVAKFFREKIKQELAFADRETRRLLNISIAEDTLKLVHREDLYKMIHLYYNKSKQSEFKD